MVKIYTLVYTVICDKIENTRSEVIGTFRNYLDAVLAQDAFIIDRDLFFYYETETHLSLYESEGNREIYRFEIFETEIQ